MSPKRSVWLVVGGAALAAWIAAAATSAPPQTADVPVRATVPDRRSQELAAEVARLHSWLQPQPRPSEHGRNLFEFGGRAAAMRPAAIAPRVDTAEAAAVPAPAPAAPVFTLDGIAEDPGAGGPVRTAIISGLGQLFLAREGDALTSRYKVLRISADVVELSDTTTNTTLTIALR
jgi:hypothetical protein